MKGMLNWLLRRKKSNKTSSSEAETFKKEEVKVSKRFAEIDPLKLTRYYRLTLKEADLVAPDFRNAKDFISVPFCADDDQPSIKSGRLSSQDTETLFEVYRSTHGCLPKGKNEGISVQISLATFYDASVAHGAYHSLLVLPARLSRSGILAPDGENWPWVNIERLHRAGIPDEELMIGGEDALRRFWSFIDRDGAEFRSQGREWEDHLKYAAKMFEFVAGKKLDIWARRKNSDLNRLSGEDESETESKIIIDSCYITQNERIVASGNIQKLYRYLEGEDSLPSLYCHLLSIAEGVRTLGSEALAGEIATCFTGTMGDEFPLTDSQRIAVRGFFEDAKGGVTAVSGPPGTGKTTMLQAIVASTLVNHALKEADPPVIVGTSTNNQAVTNIIDSFASVGKDNPTIWEHRWIIEAPKDYDRKIDLTEPLKSLAVYCPSGQKAREAQRKGYLTEICYGKNGAYTLYSDPDYSEQALRKYLEFANDAFGERFGDAKKVGKAVHERLKRINENCNALVAAFKRRLNGSGSSSDIRERVCALAKMNALGSVEEQVSSNLSKFDALIGKAHPGMGCKQIMDELDGLLDTTVRYTQFWLAVHYYEARWVGHEEDNSYLLPDELKKSTPAVMNEYWRQAAALTPCFVMTEFQIPRWMKLCTKEKGQHYDLERVDLLIVDEAGQVDTCVGAAAFSLAKRAIVVGDDRQLSPIWSMEAETDKQKIIGMGFGDDTWNVLEGHGLTCSNPSSLMRAASFASRWNYGPDKKGETLPGLFLAEHFRCHPLIINYCNKLLYGGMLKPRRPMPTSVIQRLNRLSAEGEQLDGEPEKSNRDDGADDNGHLKAYKLSGLVDNPLLFVAVEGSESQRVGNSRKNVAEAQAIAAWIAENGRLLTGIYGKKLGETVAVVTPFASQARCISQEIAKEIGSNAARSVTVGTAHRLQGAERPVVLFSCVYGDNDASASFINDTPELMNVAVSRAKDLFVIFGSQARWKDRGKVFRVVHKLATRCDGKFVLSEGEQAIRASASIREKTDGGLIVSCREANYESESLKPSFQIQRKHYLKIPFDENEEAKKLGARWDKEERLWFTMADADSEIYNRWSTYLNIPFDENEEANKLGARWDWRKKRWYAPPDRNLRDFRRWW